MDISEITSNKDNILYATIALFIVSIVFWYLRKYLIKRALFKLCGVPSSSYRLIATNLIWPNKSVTLNKNHLHGTPSAIFIKKNGKAAYICQYNPRNFKGRPKVRERYQILLFIGMIMEKYKLDNVQGAIRFSDHLEFIKYEPLIYNQLLNMQAEYNEAIKEWVAPNIQPLFKRE